MSASHFRVGRVSVSQIGVGRVNAAQVAAAGSSGTEVRFVNAVGEDVVTTWGALDGAEAVRGLPVRRIPSHAGQRHYPGSFWSATTGGHVGYESRLELDRLWLADLDPTVAWIASQPVWLCGADGPAQRRHAPDLLLQHADGSFALVDVKPAAFIEVPKVAEVFAWTGRLCAAKGWRYEVWSGASAVLMDNVRWLGGTRRLELVDPDALGVVQRVGLTGMTLGEVLAAAAPQVPASLAGPVARWLLWSGDWVADLEVPLSDATVIAWAQDAS